MSLKDFLKPSKGKIILFSILLLVYVIFYLIPGLLVIYNFAQTLSELNPPEGSNFVPFVSIAINPIEMIVTVIAEIAAIYLLSCIIITVKNKIKKI